MDISKVTLAFLFLLLFMNGNCQYCPKRCQCCAVSFQGCENDDKCVDGCMDGYHQPRCMWPCPENCKRCRQADGLCQSCKPGYYDVNRNCSYICSNSNCACQHSTCDFCLDGFYNTGQVCNLQCSKGCVGGRCKNDGTCTCITNFESDTCDSCVQGKYGELCDKNCLNPNCKCTDASNCISCKPGYFDFLTDCRKECSVGCQDVCKDDGSCSCNQQYSGNTCDNCRAGNYGANCTTPCSNGCNTDACNKDGTCVCSPKFNGSKCETCVEGYFGPECDQTCGRGCKGNTCNRNDGTCVCEDNYKGALCERCNDGLFGSTCSFLCPARCFNCSSIETCFACKDGFYGADCSLDCSGNCFESLCRKDDGLCTNGCAIGFTGKMCKDKCDDSCKACNQQQSSQCTSCFGGKSGPRCRCQRNCDCVSHSDVCSSCTNNFEVISKKCTCNKKYCVDNWKCALCLNDTFYTYGSTCCECSMNCKNRKCSTENQCLSGCVDGYTGNDCEKPCTYFDVYCKSCNQTGSTCLRCKDSFSPNADGRCMPCSGCIDDACDTETGVCEKTCKLGFWTNTCQLTCESKCIGCEKDTGRCNKCTSDNVYGPFCNMSCSSNCKDSYCDRTSGDCTNGCITNKYGTKCDNICSEMCAGNGERTKCNAKGHCINNCVKGYEGSFCNIAVAQKEDGEDKGPMAAIGGGATGGVLVIGVVVTAIVILRLRSQKQKSSDRKTVSTDFTTNPHTTINESETSPTYENALRIATPKTNASNQKQQIQAPPCRKDYSRRKKPNTESKPKTEHNLELDDNDSIARDIAIRFEEKGGIYYNNTETVSRDKIRIDTLAKYVGEKQEHEYEEEFEKFPYGLGKSFNDSQLPNNMAKNRYKGIYPYDETRVKVRDGESDYINASYIDGYNKRNKYIATLGPMSKQLGDFSIFWRMIWQEKVEVVAMVTNLIEEVKPKCEQYWPEPGTSKLYGEVKVTCETEQSFSEFTRRSFILIKGSEKRKLHHLHFTCWPDKDVPDDVTSIIDFRQAVINSPSLLHGPLLVHCSAGVGRTGIFIALDILTNEGEAEEAIAIQGCVINMRQNRPNMIQTLGQYKYLHRALVHSLTINCQTIKGENLHEYITSTNKIDIDVCFQKMNTTVEPKSDEEHRAVERNKLKDGNRPSADVPGNVNRPRPFLYLTPGASDYTNAIYIDSFTTKRRFLVAQTPLPSTLTYFFTLVMQENCSCIVNLEPDLDKKRDAGLYFPADNQVLNSGSFTVSSQKEVQKTYTKRTLKFEHSGSTGTSTGHSVPHLQFTDWDKKKVVPRSVNTFLRFIDDVEEAANSSPYDGPILIHCLDGASKSGLFCVISLLIQRMSFEGEASVVNAVRKVRSRRTMAIPCKEQFHFCYDCLLEYVNTHDENTYCNIKGACSRQ